MALCDLSQFNIKDLHQALINYIKKNLEEVANNPESRFDLDGLVRNVYDRVYNTDQNSTKSLGIAQHVPSAIITVINNNIELRNALESKGLDFKVLYKNESEYSKGLEAVTKTVDRPKDIKKYINVYEQEEETLDAVPTMDLENPNIYYILKSFSLKEPIEFNTTTFREVLLDKNNNYTSKKDPQRAYIFNTLKNILTRLQESGEPNASNITMDGQTGFKLMMFDSNEEDIKANLIPGTFNPRSTYIWAITDNDGNIIKFNNDGNVDLEDGKMVYYYVREKSNKQFITQAVDKRRDQLKTFYKNEPNKNEIIEQELEAFEKEVTEFRKNQEENTRQLIQQLNAGKSVMANITGGKTGFYDTTPTKFTDILPTLSKEEIDSISVAKVTGIAGAPFIYINGVEQAVEMRAIKKLTANDSVLVSIGQVLTYKGNDLSNEEKLKYFKKFIYPQARAINDSVPGVSIALNEDGSLFFQVRNKVFDLETAQPEEIANALQGSYLHIDSELLNSKSYTKYIVKNDRLIQSQENYLDLIKDSLIIYARPNKLPNGEYDKIVAVNGYFIWEPTVETNDKVVKDMVDENTKAVDDTDDNAWEIKFDMNKVLKEFGTPDQDRRAREWAETSNLFKIKDKNGNPVVPLNLLFNVVNSDAWATFSNSGVTLFKGSNYTHAYHEAWHAFSQLFLTKDEKRKLYAETAKLQGEFEVPVRIVNSDGTTSFELNKVKFSEATPRQLEEYIAEEFRKYAISRGEIEVKQKERKNIFKRIWEALKALFTGVRISEVVNEPETIQHLKESFDNLYVGKLNTYMPSIDNVMFSKLRAGIANVKEDSEPVPIKPGVSDIFQANPELAKIGTQEQYSQYIESIFPDSQVKDIVYHGTRTKEEFEKFITEREYPIQLPQFKGKISKGSFFTKDKNIADVAGIRTITAILNMKNPLYKNKGSEYLFKEDVEDIQKNNDSLIAPGNKEEFIVFEPDQIHILGSKQDIEGFKNYISETASQKFTATESKAIIESMDGIISKYMISKSINKDSARALDDQGRLVNSFKDKAALSDLYKIVLDQFIKRVNFLDGRIEKTEDLERKNLLVTQRNLIQRAINNYGGLNESLSGNQETGVIAYHMRNSTFKDQIARAEDDSIEETLTNSQRMFDRKNYVNLEEEADIMTLFLIKSLIEQTKNSKGEYVDVYNDLGFPKLANYKSNLNFLIKNLSGERRFVEMYNKIKELSNAYPIYKQLLSRLGDPSDSNMSDLELNMWAKFLQDFNKPTIKIFQNLVEYVPNEESGEWVIKIGRTATGDDRVLRDWSTGFELRIPSKEDPYIKYDTVNKVRTTILNLDRVFLDFIVDTGQDKFRYKLKDNSNIFKFLNAIGINLTDNQLIRRAIKDLNLYEDINYITNEIGLAYESKPQSQLQNPLKNLKSALSDRFKTLANIEANLSDKYNSLMRMAPGERPMYEQNLNSTATQIADGLNSPVDFKDMMDNDEFKHMRYLSPTGKKNYASRNPWTNSSILINSLFDMTSAKGSRRKDNKGNNTKLDIVNLGGTEILNINEYVGDGIPHSDMSRADKFLTDFYSVMKAGLFEQPRHGSKSSFFGTRVSKIYTYDSKGNNNLFVDHHKFITYNKEDAQDYEGFRIMTPFLMKYLNSDLIRIYKYEKDREIYDKIAGFENYGNFSTFDKVLSDKTKNKLKSDEVKDLVIQYGSLTNIFNNRLLLDLETDIKKEMKNYFDNLISRVNNNVFQEYKDGVVDDVYTGIKQSYPNATKEQLEQAAVRSFVYNTWFNNVEMMILYYGDPLQYKVQEDEFHKRIGTMFATGKVMPTDIVSQAWAARMGRPYFDKMVKSNPNFKPNELAKQKRYNGTMNTAVLDDSKPSSIYISILEELFKKEYKAEGKSDKDINIALYGKNGIKNGKPTGGLMKPFYDMKEGDGQGWISFDSYRLLKKLEGDWSEDIQEPLYKKIVEGEYVSTKQMMEVFPVYKLLYSGPLAMEGDLLPMTAIHKFSLFPLSPNAIKNTGLEKLHMKMMEQGVDYTLYKSGSKLTTVTNNNKRISDVAFIDGNTNDFNDDVEFTINPIYTAYLKDQLKLGNDFKSNARFSTQLRALLPYGLFEGGIPVDYKGKREWKKLSNDQKRKGSKFYSLVDNFRTRVQKLIDYEKDNLLNEIGWTKDKSGKPIGPEKSLVEFVQKEMREQGFSEHDIKYLDYDEDMNMIYNTISIDTSLQSDRIERMLLAIINNRIIRQKIKGTPFVEVSGAFANSTDTKFFKPTKEDYEKYKFSYPDAVKNYEQYVTELRKNYGTSGLPFYLPVLGSATKAMKVKIALQGDYVNMFKLKHPDGELIEVTKEEEYTEDGKKKTRYVLDEEASLKRLNQAIKDENWLNIGDHRKMITLTGVRIPVQYLNSMEFAEVYEFLPPDAGPIIILPAEIVAKSGTDFDVDKLTMYTAHITRLGKYVKDEYQNPDEIMDDIDHVLDQLDAATKKLTGKLYDSKKLIKRIREDIKEKRALDSQKFQMLLADRDLLRAKLDVIISKVLKDLNLEKNKRNISKRLYKAIFEIQNTRDVYNVLSDTKKLENKRNYNLLSKSGKAEFEKASKLVEQIDAIYDIINESSKAYKIDIEKTEIQIEQIKKLNNRYQDLYYQYNNFKSGIENGLIEDIRAILELPENAYRLLKPNDVHLTKVVAEELEDEVQDYDYRINGRRSPTTLLEYDYNLKKHQDNIIAGESLGITAKGNKFNQYSTEGNNYVPAKTKVYYSEKVRGKRVRKSVDVDSEIFLKSNVEYRVNKDGLEQKFISLAKLYNTKKKGKKLVKDNEIGEIFNQLISGFVDAEKDPWVAFIQGNKQTIPLLLNLLEAGVEFRQAVLFVSNPLVRQYVRLQQENKGVFTQIRYGEKVRFPKAEARQQILKSLDYSKLDLLRPRTRQQELDLDIESGEQLTADDIAFNQYMAYKVMIDLKDEVLADTDGEFTDNDLRSMLESNSDLVSENIYRKQVLGLLHFMFVDTMFDGNNQLKQIADPDTNKQTSLFDNQVRKNKLKKLKDDGLVAPEQVDFMTKDSVIKGFFLEDFALDVFGPLFKLTNNEVFNNFLEKQISDFQNRLAIEEYTGMDIETYTKRFRKDFTLFILTNYINNFNPGKSGFYKGIRLKEQAVPVSYAEGFDTSAFVKEEKDGPVLYIDPARIRNEFLNKDYTKTRKIEGSSYADNNLSFVNDGYFTTEKEYYNFVAEREYLRYLNPITKLIKEPAYQKTLAEFKKLRPITEGQTLEEYEQSSIRNSYEVYIKNLALDNIWNHTKLFDSGLETYAAQLDGYIKKYPFLTEKFKVLSQFLIRGKNERGTVKQSDSLYLTLRDATTMDGETASEYHDELLKLATEPVLLGDSELIKAENKILNDFFKRISVYAFLQSGMNTGTYSITKIVPTDGYKSILEEAINEIGKIDDRILAIYNNRLLQRYDINNKRSTQLPFNYITDLDQELIRQKEYGLELYPKNSLGQKIKSEFVKPTATENIFILEDKVIARDKTTGANIGMIDSLFEIPKSEKDKQKEAEKRSKTYIPRTNLEILIDALGPEYHVVLDDTMQRRLLTNKFDIMSENVLLKEKFGRPLPAELSKYVVYQNKVSGVESYGSTVTARDEIIKQLGPNPTSFQMTKAGLRKRTTRSGEQMQKLGNLEVGDILVQRESDSNEYVLTKVTGIYYKGTPGYEGTWQLEGWRDEDVKAIRRYKSKDGYLPAAITFEKVREDAVLGLRTYKSIGSTAGVRTLSPLNLTDENIQLGKQYLEEDINAIKGLYKQGKKILFLSKGYGQVYAEDLAAQVTKQSLPSNVQIVSPDYGVVQAETNPTESEKKADVDLIKSHIQNQSFKENVGQYANEMFHYGLRWGRKNYNFYVLKNGKYVKSTLEDLGSQLYSRNKEGKFVKSNRKDKAAYNNGLLNPLDIDSFAGKADYYGYDLVDQNGNPLPSIKELQPIIDKIEATIGVDMKDYDSVIGNIYLPGEYVYPHKDTSESKTARGYPVIVYSIGNDAGLGIVDNNEGKMTFANQYDTKWLPDNEKLKGYTNEIITKHGTIYTFGMDGKGRFELTHSTPINSRKDTPQTPITLPNGKVVTNYTITLTFRRAANLTPGMPKTPAMSPAKTQVKTLYQGYNKLENREFNYFALSKEEAQDYGKNVRQVSVDTTGFLKRGEGYNTERTNFKKETGKSFDILDNSPEGLRTQSEFFTYLKNKGYKGLDITGGIDSQYVVTFTPITPVTTKNKPEEYTNHSGGAKGADEAWDMIPKELGFNTKDVHYREPGQTTVDSEALRKLGREAKPMDPELYARGKEIADRIDVAFNENPNRGYGYYRYRNYAQVYHADAVFAISSGFGQRAGRYAPLDRGTLYAIYGAIIDNKPVYVFDQKASVWRTWDTPTKSWKTIDTPTLTKNFAGVGSRTLLPQGREAIKQVIQKTFGTTAPAQPSAEPSTVNQANYKEDFFVYLSKRLAQEFRYVNPKSENKPSMSEILSTMRPITKEEIEDAKRNCTTL